MTHQLIKVTSDNDSKNIRFKAQAISILEIDQYIKDNYSPKTGGTEGKLQHKYTFGRVGEPVSQFIMFPKIVSDDELDILSVNTYSAEPISTRISLEKHAIIIFHEITRDYSLEFLYIVPNMPNELRQKYIKNGYNHPVYYITPVSTSDDRATELAEEYYQKSMIIFEEVLSRQGY